MPPSVAALLYAAGILTLCYLDRDRKERTSRALWVAIAWLLILGSRPVSQWLAAFGLAAPNTADVVEQYLDGDPIDRPVFTGLLLAGIFVLAGRAKKVRPLLRANLPIVLFFLYAGLSCIWSDFAFVAFKRWFKSLGDVVMVLIVLTEPDRDAALKRYLGIPSFVLIPLSVLFIKYYPALGRGYRAFKWTPLYTGVTTNKNTLGIICLLFGLAALWRFTSAWRERRNKLRTRLLLAHGSIVLLVAWLFWMANSMTSLACFMLAAALLVGAGLRPVIRSRALIHCMIAIVIVVPYMTLFLGIGGGALEEMGRDASLTGRTGIWDLVLSITGNPFLGTGFESFWLGWRLARVWEIMPGIQEAHNGYLEVYLNLGWIGIALMLGMVVTGYRNVIARYRRDPQTGRLMAAYFCVAVVYNFTEAGFRMMNPILVCFFLATLALPVTRRAAASDTAPGRRAGVPELAAAYKECR